MFTTALSNPGCNSHKVFNLVEQHTMATILFGTFRMLLAENKSMWRAHNGHLRFIVDAEEKPLVPL